MLVLIVILIYSIICMLISILYANHLQNLIDFLICMETTSTVNVQNIHWMRISQKKVGVLEWTSVTSQRTITAISVWGTLRKTKNPTSRRSWCPAVIAEDRVCIHTYYRSTIFHETFFLLDQCCYCIYTKWNFYKELSKQKMSR